MHIIMPTIKDFLREYAKEKRKALHLSQEDMAERLHIAPKSYSDLERGVYCFSAQSMLMLFLLLPEEELLAVMEELRRLVREGNNHAA